MGTVNKPIKKFCFLVKSQSSQKCALEGIQRVNIQIDAVNHQ